MVKLDALIDEMAKRFGLGASSGPLVREALALMVGSPGGINGFLGALRSAGLSSEVASWLLHPDAAPLLARETERVLGPSALQGIANRTGLPEASVSAPLGYAIPRLVGLLARNGAVPKSLPPK